jgi:hypothetical protein
VSRHAKIDAACWVCSALAWAWFCGALMEPLDRPRVGLARWDKTVPDRPHEAAQRRERHDMSDEKTHYKKAFDSPYLSSADLTEPVVLTIDHVRLEPDRTKKTQDKFNTAHVVEKEIRRGEALKPMILNAGNSKTMKRLTGSPFIDDWNGVRVTIYVDPNVKFGRETVEGLRINPRAPEEQKKALTPSATKAWERAKVAFRRDGDLVAILKHAAMTEEHQTQLMDEVAAETGTAA